MFVVQLTETNRLEVEPGKSIRCLGKAQKCIRTPQGEGEAWKVEWITVDVDQTFRIGDRAVYGAYNLTYTGQITSIGKKLVTIKDDSETKRHTFERFAFWNWNRDFDAVDRNNADTLMHI